MSMVLAVAETGSLSAAARRSPCAGLFYFASRLWHPYPFPLLKEVISPMLFWTLPL
jgi:hypothetical protein